MKCKHCGYESDNSEIFVIHELNCLEEQKQNGLIVEPNPEEPPDPNNSGGSDYNSMTLDQLKTICKENNLEGYSNLNKDDLIAFVRTNIKG